jgi:hypothetical protein
MNDSPLPEPESEQLAALVGSGSIRLVYGLLHRRQHNPPTSGEIGLFLQAGASADTSADRALRYLRDYFDIATVRTQGEERYQLRGWAGTQPASGVLPVSSRLRAEILAPARCAQCGRTPMRHGVVLNVDLRVPPDWGGTNDPETYNRSARNAAKVSVSTYRPMLPTQSKSAKRLVSTNHSDGSANC